MTRRISKNTRVLLLIGLMAASSLVAYGAVYSYTTTDNAAVQRAQTQLRSLQIDGSDYSATTESQEAALNEFVLSGDPAALTHFQGASADADAIANRVLALKDLPEVRQAFEALAQSSTQWRIDVAEPAIAAVQRNDAVEITRFVALSVDDHVAVEAAYERLVSELTATSAVFEERAAGVASTTIIGVIIAFSVMLLAFGIALVAVRRFGQALELDAKHASVLNRFT
ncbi:MAG: CHASE3 domain-containing protein, partial [Chloroflexota bacterium]